MIGGLSFSVLQEKSAKRMGVMIGRNRKLNGWESSWKRKDSKRCRDRWRIWEDATTHANSGRRSDSCLYEPGSEVGDFVEENLSLHNVFESRMSEDGVLV